ncbi:uncharacterized protein LOC108952924 isoform X1 [Musa acuminata AAA Group]|uniref:uncharacterized protein LOC108952924 isoform X1 n=2 Tax=Musa acuminata AAA Group TaxID=214697 RepID=UPI0031D9CEA2
MSMLDAFFNKGFRGAKCKTLLKLTIPRIRLLRNRREIQLKQMRKDIAKLLEDGQEATARIRVEHIIREENMMAAQEILELFCELIAVRLPIIESQRECPLDLKEAISTICFAAPRCADLPELQQVQMLFAAKYGKEFATAATYLLPDCGVNRQVIELLSIRVPSVETKMKLLKEIAEQHELDWDPSVTENEFRKPHEDLLNGPNHVTNGSSLPLLPQKHDEHDDALSSDHTDESHIEPGSDADLDSLDLPQVPKDSVRATIDVPSALGNVSSRPPSAAHDLGFGHPEVTKSIPSEDMAQVPPVEPAVSDTEPSSTSSPNQSNAVLTANKQFIPFLSPPPLSSFSAPPKQNEFSDPASLSSTSQPAPSPPTPYSISPSPNGGECVLPPPPLSSFSDYQAQNEPASSHPSFSSRAKCEIDVDLQDVLTAAQSAAETAEHAAIAARAAANLAQVRLTDLLAKSENSGNESHGEGFEEQTDLANPIFHHQQYSFGNNEKSTDYGQGQIWDSPTHRSHEPQSSPVSEDEPYLSYPNLFASKDSYLKSDIHD